MTKHAPLDVASIQRWLVQMRAPVGRPVKVFTETGSTNDEAKAAVRSGAPEGSLFLAESQTAGRGRGGKSWHSPSGENLYLSLVVRPDVLPQHIPMVSLVTGVAVGALIDATLEQSGLEPRAMIKWPNDVYVDDAKIAGILVEAVTRGGAKPDVIIGVGLNVSSETFPSGLKQPATSLALLGCSDLDRNHLAAAFCQHIGKNLERFVQDGPSSMLRDLASRDWLAGRYVTVGGLEGLASGIDELGQLEVRDAMGCVHAVMSDEVSVNASPR